jgi:hypothetical protein
MCPEFVIVKWGEIIQQNFIDIASRSVALKQRASWIQQLHPSIPQCQKY